MEKSIINKGFTEKREENPKQKRLYQDGEPEASRNILEMKIFHTTKCKAYWH